MRKILLVCAALACMTVSPVPAQDAAVKKIIEMGQNDNQVMHQLDILTNRFGGRLIGSDAYENAAEWMVREFKSWGLDVQLEEAGTVPVGFNRGPWFGRLLSDNGMILHFATPSYTSGTKGVQRGHAVMEPQRKIEWCLGSYLREKCRLAYRPLRLGRFHPCGDQEREQRDHEEKQ